MQTIPLTAETFLMGFASTGRAFKFEKEVSSIEVDGRPYKVIEGLTKSLLSDGVDKVYAVTTPDENAKGWRLALLTQQASHPFGFSLLFGQSAEPTFTDLPKPGGKAAVGLACKDKDGNQTVVTVLVPYQLPVSQNKKIGNETVAEVGVPVFYDDNESAIVPVRFRGGTYGILFCHGSKLRLFAARNDEVAKLVAHSSKMPVIREGIGSSVWHIFVGDGEKGVLIKSYYNDKDWRGDEVYR